MGRKMVTWELVKDAVTISGTGNSTTDWIDVGGVEALGYKIIIDSGTLPKIKLETQVIESNTGNKADVGNAVPGDLKEANKSATIPDTGNPLVAEITSGSKADGFTLMPTRWFRYKITGNSGNDTDTVVSLWSSKLENY